MPGIELKYSGLTDLSDFRFESQNVKYIYYCEHSNVHCPNCRYQISRLTKSWHSGQTDIYKMELKCLYQSLVSMIWNLYNFFLLGNLKF